MTRPEDKGAPMPGEGRADDDRPGLDAEVRALREELAHLRRHRMFVLYQSVPRVLFFRFLSGMAVGLGTVIGATVLLSLIVWALSQIEFVPIIGEWAVQVATEIEALLEGAD
jgi:hypothetical protein